MVTFQNLAGSLVAAVAQELVEGGREAGSALRRAAGAGASGVAKRLTAEIIERAALRMATRGAADVAVEAPLIAAAATGAAATTAIAPVVAVTGAARTGTALAGAAARETARFGARQVMRSAVRASAVAAVAGLVVEQALDSFRYARGEIDRGDYGRRTAENVVSAAGGFGGACAGAALGTAVLPGAGTAIGGVAGGLFGALGAARGLRAFVVWRGRASLIATPA